MELIHLHFRDHRSLILNTNYITAVLERRICECNLEVDDECSCSKPKTTVVKVGAGEYYVRESANDVLDLIHPQPD